MQKPLSPTRFPRYPGASPGAVAAHNSRCSCIPLSAPLLSGRRNHDTSSSCKRRNEPGRGIPADYPRATGRRPRAGTSRPRNSSSVGTQIHTAEQLVVDPRSESACPRRADDQRDSGAGVVEGGLGPRQRRAVVGHEHHPGVAVQPGVVQDVQQLSDRGVGDRDRAVEIRQVLPDRRGCRADNRARVTRAGSAGSYLSCGYGRWVSKKPAVSRNVPASGRCPRSHSVARSTTYSQYELETSNSSKPSRAGKLVSCCMPKSAVSQPASPMRCGKVRTPVRYSQPWWANPTSPLDCGYRPVNSDPRDGEHSGAVAWARVNRIPSAARRSSLGLSTSVCP